MSSDAPQRPAGLSVEEARHFIEKIAVGHGYIAAETLAAMPPDVRRIVEEALKKDSKSPLEVSQLLKTLAAGNINVAFELLQNMDDNQYTQARAVYDAPWLSVVVAQDMIYIESNEDGFTENDVKALCDVNKSSKAGKPGYIGQPAVGFKSVFTIASRVHIESGPFSFCFQHQDGESGIGMVRPFWAVLPTVPDHVKSHVAFGITKTRTKMVLHLKEENTENLRATFANQLWETPTTALIFMKNLRRLKITILNNDNKIQRAREVILQPHIFGSGCTISTVNRFGGTEFKMWHRFQVYKGTANNLAANTNRRNTPSQLVVVSDPTAEIILAFPVDDKNEPMINTQKVFAFMPLRDAGFKFLIHSDFVTDATRGDIVVTSQRNISIRNAIADVFMTAMEDLCKKPVLEHRWMRYLPQQAQLPSNPFWRELCTLIRAGVMTKSLVRPWSQQLGRVYKIELLNRLTDEQMDKDKQPLVPDLLTERYLSAGYETEDLDILTEYGLTYMEMWAVFPRLQAFITSDAWKAKAFEDRDEDWHARLARLILKLWNSQSFGWKKTLKSLPLLPLLSKEVRVPSEELSDVFFPDIDGVPVPEDLDIPMILPAAAANPDCRKLYEILGVKKVEPHMVRTMIITMYENVEQVAKLDVAKSVSHLRYLYRLEPKDMINKDEQEALIIFDHKERVRHPRQEYVYLPGEGDWSPGNLLQPPFPPNAPEVDASLIHPMYLEDPPDPSEGNTKSWLDWLFHAVYCEEKIQLFTVRNPDAEAQKTYSPEYLFIIQTRPEQALTRLMTNFQKPEVKKLWVEDKIGSKLMSQNEFLCMDGVRRSLEDSFLPLAPLLLACEENAVRPETMPILKLNGPILDADLPAWLAFAEHFGIGVTRTIGFYLALLRSIANNTATLKSTTTVLIVAFYLKIHEQYLEATDKVALGRQIRTFFSENKCILCNTIDRFGEQYPARWAFHRECLWIAPEEMVAYVPLKKAWAPFMEKLAPRDSEKLEQFFRQTLLIRNLSTTDILTELAQLSRQPETPSPAQNRSQLIHQLYFLLNRLTETLVESAKAVVKRRFRDEALIYNPNHQGKKWFKLSETVWSSEDSNETEARLEDIYPTLESLFVDFLEVTKMSSSLTVKGILEVGQNVKEISHVKQLLWLLNESILKKSPPSISPFQVKSCRIFPVRMQDGTVQPMTEFTEFYINDRPRYADALGDKINVLDFTVQEAHRLKPLIEWLNLTARCLSKAVTEKTSVDVSQRVEDRPFAQDISSKANAFASIAAHFSRDVDQSRRLALFSSFRRIEVFRHADIKSNIKLTYGFKSITVPLGRSELHVSMTFNKRHIYLPQDDEDRDFCITTRLPRELTADLLRCNASEVDPNALVVVASVLQARLQSVGRILDSYGIAMLSTQPEEDSSNPSTPMRQTSAEVVMSPGGASVARTLFQSPIPAVSPADSRRASSTPYQALLIQVTSVARLSTFPDKKTAFDMNAISQSLQETGRSGTFTFAAGDKTDWQRMVGAAGELFVFELLSRLPQALPGFSRNNWQSTVRHFANVHPDYSTLTDWHGAELGDLYYDDAGGTFTKYLIEGGYLDESWIDEKPEYFIEVKTTTSGRFDTPFYMSKYQYARMLSYVNTINTATQRRKGRKVYILFRVYGIESGQVGVRIYVDLEESRKNGELEFEAERWTITPRQAF